MKTIIMIAAMVMAASVSVVCQDREPQPLPKADLGWSGVEADSVLAFDERPFLRGWNWLSTDSDASNTMGMNMWHLDDPFAWDATATRFLERYVPGQLLASTIDGISHNDGHFKDPSESIAMEWQPWLEPEYDPLTNRDTFALRSDDATGGVWGFHTRHPNGSVVKDPTDGYYRFRLEQGDVPKSQAGTVVLDDAECTTGLSRFEEATGDYSPNTLYLAINLRRNEAEPLSADRSEVVLRVRVPIRSLQNTQKPAHQQGSPTYARFKRLVDRRQRVNDITSTLGQPMGRRMAINDADVGTAVEELVITRGMLGIYWAVEQDITIYAMLDFSWDGLDPRDKSYWNPRFVKRSVRNKVMGPDDKNNAPLTAEVGVQVLYTGAVGVDIKSVRLESKQSMELFWGQQDRLIQESVKTFTDRLVNLNRNKIPTAGHQPRLWRIYGRDEIRPMHWKGFRYIHRLLHNTTTTEWYPMEISKAKHCLQLQEYWSGTTPEFSPQAGSPLFRHGSEWRGMQDTLDLYAGHTYGRDNIRDYETRLYWSKRVVDAAGNQVWDQRTAGALPLGADSVDMFLKSYGAGVLGHIEKIAQEGYRDHPQLLFDPSVVLLGNTWEYSTLLAQWKEINNARHHWLGKADKTRAKSVEELRLLQWMPMILGAKGLIHYSGESLVMPDTSRLADGTGEGWELDTKGKNRKHTSMERSICASVPLGKLPAAAANLIGDARIDSDMLGADYLEPNEPTRYNDYLPRGLAATALALNGGRPNPPGFPMFRKSMRQVIREAHRSLAPFADSLVDLQLTAWRAKGFTSWFIGDTTAYSSWLDNSVEAQRVWVPAVTDATVRELEKIRREPYDSTFYDVTLFRHQRASLDTLCFVGVLNRRTDPRLDTTIGQDPVMTYDQLKAHVKEHPEDLYGQYGARRIRIPFNYARHENIGGRAVNLRVRELRTYDTTMVNQRPAIDTVIGHATSLDVDLLPGEGKIFRVSVVEASSQNETGFLDHSNQRKIVAYPTVKGSELVHDTTSMPVRTWQRIIAGDSMYYHRVFHRRAAGPNGPAGPLTVWYQRSAPLARQHTTDSTDVYAFDASTISWEAPINISSRVGITNATNTTTIADLSCGYPALVVRPDFLQGQPTANVYVVFACEGPNQQQAEVLVCETVLPAELPRADQEASYQLGYSHVLDQFPVDVGPPGGANPVTRATMLEHWGTPMINASRNGNYYCWSHPTNGIGAGFKEPDRRQFGNDQQIYLRHLDAPSVSAHPSLNTYSRLHLGETDAGLVWQEGSTPADGGTILYTRLFLNNAGALEYGLTPTDPDISLAPNFVSQQNQQIAILTEAALMTHAFPVLYRQLSDWDLQESARHYSVGLVNYKAERAYWQSKPSEHHYVAPNWCIGRRVFDLSVGSQRGPVSGALLPDSIIAHSENFIFSEALHLKGPDATQGEQWGEWGSTPAHNAWDHDDSTSVLEFWSEPADGTLAPPRLWHMRMSWLLYGTDADYDHADLVASGAVKRLQDAGSHPHLAARHSMRGAANRGWQRNRRIFSEPYQAKEGYGDAPAIWTSSEYFYRTGAEANAQPQALPYRGFRRPGEHLLVSPLHVQQSDQWLTFRNSDDVLQPATHGFVTEWTSLPAVATVDLGVAAMGSAPLATLAIQSEQTGQMLFWDVGSDAAGSGINAGSTHVQATLLSTPTDRYRLILQPLQMGREDAAWPAQDVEIVLPGTEAFARTQHSPQMRQQLIDLRSMKTVAIGEQYNLHVYPNPAMGMLTMAVSLPSELAPWQRNLHILITDVMGRLVWSAPCDVVDVMTADTAPWPVGTYTITVRSDVGIVTRSRFSVVK